MMLNSAMEWRLRPDRSEILVITGVAKMRTIFGSAITIAICTEVNSISFKNRGKYAIKNAFAKLNVANKPLTPVAIQNRLLVFPNGEVFPGIDIGKHYKWRLRAPADTDGKGYSYHLC
ncbi:hypothetical protein GCM10007094_21000 [Pseudovibrio japonicus]|uniref:Uncharacterized protein n=1 Tax=Pseudovibrio japonicus TaxID=366534 RepID=A0ABQ3ECG6_9HYPH|nr:hypothetical protein GCM10007094_21000 [Pseudovibrio japonicus]